MFRAVKGVRKASITVGTRRFTGVDSPAISSHSPQTEEWSVFPRQREGNVYTVNWSMCEDGVVPVGDAFRNARLPLLANKLGKPENGKFNISKPSFHGSFTLNEAGDSITHEQFEELFAIQQEKLSSGQVLFVEDAVLGAHNSTRNGVRITTDDPGLALIAKSLLIPAPPVELNHVARFKGWNLEARNRSPNPIWNGSQYDLPNELPQVAKAGQRPIVAFVGGAANTLAVQFVENSGEIVGANVVAGSGVPVRGLIEAIGLADTVLVNVQHAHAVALPCTAFVKGKETVVVINADDSVVEEIASSGKLFGAYHNVLTEAGVSPVWNGHITNNTGSVSTDAHQVIPQVVANGFTLTAVNPHNLAHPAKQFIFYEKGSTKAKLSHEDAVKRLVDLTEESKAEVIKKLLEGSTISVIGNAAEVKAHLQIVECVLI